MGTTVTVTANVRTDVFNREITHNLREMAIRAGLYYAIWHPELVARTAGDLIPLLVAGIKVLDSNPDYFREQFSPGEWGQYEDLYKMAVDLLEVCEHYPEGSVHSFY